MISAMPKKAKVTTTTTTSANVVNQFGRINRTAREARMDLGELPIVYVTNRDERTVGIAPAWLLEWVEANADAVLESITLTHATG
jgi:hypothetical protein